MGWIGIDICKLKQIELMLLKIKLACNDGHDGLKSMVSIVIG